MPGNELEVLSHYKRKIEKNLEDEDILLRSLAKLDGVRVNIGLLQDTGIGRTVSLLKKQYADHEIGTKSRDLVTKWKDVVAREEDVSEESAEDKEEGASATGDEQVQTKGASHGSPPSYTPTPKAAAYVPTPLSGYVPTPLAELKHESKGSENHNLDEHYENEEHNGTNGHVETEVTQRNGNEEDSDREHHKKSKKHKKDKEREKDRKDKHRNDDDKEKTKKRKSSHRDHSEEESDQVKTEIKSETISHSLIKKERIDKEERKEGEKHSHEDKKDKYGSREDKRDKKDKHTKEKENKEKSREHKSSNGEHRSSNSEHKSINGEQKSRHEKSNGEQSRSNGEHSKSSSSKHSESRDKEREKERKIKSEKDVQEGKSHKDKHREKDRTKDDSDRKHSSSKSKDRPKSDMEESHDRSEKQRLKDKKKKSESAALGGFDMFANPQSGGGDKKHKKRPREDSTEENNISCDKPTFKQQKVDEIGFSAAMDHKKFKLPTPPRIDPTHMSGPSFIPDISPHYKPLPRAPPPPNNHNRDEGVSLDALISGRNKRQQAVYSGAKRAGYRGEVPSLKDQCIQKLKDNVDDIYECGGLSFDVLEPILIRASAETLMQIELYNPYLMEDTGNIWEGFCKKEFRNKQRNAEDLESWREMYERCIREREEKLQQLKNKVSKNFNARGEAKDSAARQTKMAFVDQVSKPPREVRAQQAKNGTALPVGHSFKPGAGNAKVGMRNSDPTRSSGVMTSKKPKTAPMMAKVRRMMRR